MSEHTALTIARHARACGMGSGGLIHLLSAAGCKLALMLRVVRRTVQSGRGGL